MVKNRILFFSPVLILISLVFLSFQDAEKEGNFDETVKVALREIGNKLLLANKDSISLVLPIKKVKENHYRLEFQNQLAITPDSLVNIVNTNLKVAKLPKRYIVEVLSCTSEDVFYSFKINRFTEEDIVPCLGRNLPNNCYTVHVLFLEDSPIFNAKRMALFGGAMVLVVFLLIRLKKEKHKTDDNGTYVRIGNYKFYQDQNKLIRNATEIKLSTKECELIHMFSKHQNEIIKRDVLIKHIWEDNGVFVGRSLDTFISKLRKKFKDDDTINIINVHGVGYKLEVRN